MKSLSSLLAGLNPFRKKSGKLSEGEKQSMKARAAELRLLAETYTGRIKAGELNGFDEELAAIQKELQHPYYQEKNQGLVKSVQQKLDRVEDDLRLLRSGFPLPPTASCPAYEPEPKVVFYVIHSCVPMLTNGYAVRSHRILKALREAGWEAFGVVRAGFPVNEKSYRAQIETEGLEAVRARLPKPPRFEEDGVPYLFCPEPALSIDMLKSPQIELTAAFIIEQARLYRPAVIHAASNSANGMAALLAGRKLGIPVVYEIRGLWELTQAFAKPGFDRSEQFALLAALEAQTASAADRVFSITRGVADRLAERGVERSRFTILSNAVDSTEFSPKPRDLELEARYQTAGKLVIGYGGSVTAYEGLELMLEALSEMPEALRSRIKVMIVGGGGHLESLQKFAAGLAGKLEVIFTGRVAFHEMAKHYTLFDIAPLPRVKSPLTDAVSPIKPFELMAMEKAVIASDVEALAEIVAHEDTGLLHKADDKESLRAGLERLISDEELRFRLGRTAREWVIRERSWQATADILSGTYRELAADRHP